MTKATIQTKDGRDQILVRDVQERSGWFTGILDRISCSGHLVALLRQFEDAANDNLMVEVDRIHGEIDALDLVVVWEDGVHARCVEVQLMNGIDVCFKADPWPGRPPCEEEY